METEEWREGRKRGNKARINQRDCEGGKEEKGIRKQGKKERRNRATGERLKEGKKEKREKGRKERKEDGKRERRKVGTRK